MKFSNVVIIYKMIKKNKTIFRNLEDGPEKMQ